MGKCVYGKRNNFSLENCFPNKAINRTGPFKYHSIAKLAMILCSVLITFFLSYLQPSRGKPKSWKQHILAKVKQLPASSVKSWNDKFADSRLQVSWNYCAFWMRRTSPSYTPYTWEEDFAHWSAPPEVQPKYNMLDWRKVESKTFPSQNSPSPCALHSHICHCSIPAKFLHIIRLTYGSFASKEIPRTMIFVVTWTMSPTLMI